MNATPILPITRRLALKVSAIIIVIETLVLGGLGMWYVSRYAARIDEQLETQARLPGSLMQQGLLRFGAVRDPQALGRLIGQDIADAVIIREDGSVFETADQALLGRPAAQAVNGFEFRLDLAGKDDRTERSHGQPPRLAQLTALSNDGRLIGWLYLRLATGPAEAAKRELAWRYGLTTAASIALTALIQILLLQWLFNRRIHRTVAVLEQAREGELAARLPGPFAADELGQLQLGVNALLAAVETRTAERLAAAAALAASEAEYRLLVENQSDMVVKVDLEGRFIYVSPSYCRTFGLDQAALLGQSFMPVVYEDDRAATAVAMETLYRPPYTAYMEQRTQTPQGWRWFSWQDTLIRDDAGRPQAIIGVGRDISVQKELHTQLQQAQKMDAIGQLAGGVAHDFNNLLTGILGGCQLLERNLPEGAAERSYVAMIQASATSAADLTGRLLSFARKAPLQRKVVDAEAVARAAVGLMRYSIDRRIAIDLQGGGALPVLADATALQHAIINLVLNARDVLPGGGRIAVVLSRLEPDHGESDLPAEALVEIRVEDDGPGIPPKILPRIFEPFFTTKALGKGTGLGLAAVYATMREHAGAVRVESRPGRTAFRLLLPLSSLQPERRTSGSSPLPSGRGVILVVEDEPVVRQLAGEVLGRMGYEVLLAEDGQRALDLVEGRIASISCVLLDLVMPVLNGPDCFLRLRALDPALPVVLCSGYDRDTAADNLLAAGANGLVLKPYDFATLASAIKAAAR